MALFYQPGIPEGVHYLDPDESRHAVKVLRLQEGDAISITDGKGVLYESQIVAANPARSTFRIIKSNPSPRNTFRRHVAIAPTKNADRMEWFVEKAVELGIDEVSFMICRNSERKSINLDRIEKIAVSAMKQSQQTWLPLLPPLQPFMEILKTSTAQKFIAFVDNENPDQLKTLIKAGSSCLVLIGPEGDFSTEELRIAMDTGFQKVGLGRTRLRTETAGLAACHIMNLVNE